MSATSNAVDVQVQPKQNSYYLLRITITLKTYGDYFMAYMNCKNLKKEIARVFDPFGNACKVFQL
jgi:hypothetical protein